MHRTTGSGYQTDPDTGENSHIDQDLTADPPVPGTTGSAEFFNALQEEIVNVVENAGLTVAADPATDRTAGWEQLKEAIFDSAAIDTAALTDGAVTNAKIDSMSLSKLTAGKTSITETYGDNDYVCELLVNGTASEYGSSVYFRRNNNSSNIDHVCGLSFLNFYAEYYGAGVKQNSAVLGYNGLVFDQPTGEYNSRYSLSQAYIIRDVGSGTTVTTAYMDVSAGFYHRLVESSVMTEIATLHYNGLSFKRSNYKIQHMTIDVSGESWAGSNPWNVAFTYDIPSDAKPVAATLSQQLSSNGVYYFPNDTDSYGNYYIAIDMDAATPEITIKTYLDPASCDQCLLTIWYTRDTI